MTIPFEHYQCLFNLLSEMGITATQDDMNNVVDVVRGMGVKPASDQHTPLPWEKKELPRIYELPLLRVIGPDGDKIANFYGPDREANAALFMASPGLQALADFHLKENLELRAEIERLKAELSMYKDSVEYSNCCDALMADHHGQTVCTYCGEDCYPGIRPIQ